MRIALDPAAREPLSAQLRSVLASRVASGHLRPGERLPTIRDLAVELGIAPNTVARAYRDLEAAGLVVGRGRRGTFVVERLPGSTQGRDARLAEAAEAYVRRARQLGFSREEALAAVRRSGRRSSS